MKSVAEGEQDKSNNSVSCHGSRAFSPKIPKRQRERKKNQGKKIGSFLRGKEATGKNSRARIAVSRQKTCGEEEGEQKGDPVSAIREKKEVLKRRVLGGTTPSPLNATPNSPGKDEKGKGSLYFHRGYRGREETREKDNGKHLEKKKET